MPVYRCENPNCKKFFNSNLGKCPFCQTPISQGQQQTVFWNEAEKKAEATAKKLMQEHLDTYHKEAAESHAWDNYG